MLAKIDPSAESSQKAPGAPGVDSAALAIRGFAFLFGMPLVLLVAALPLVLLADDWHEARLGQYAAGTVALCIVAALVLLQARREPLPGVRAWFGRLRWADIAVAAVLLTLASATLWGFGLVAHGPRVWHIPRTGPETAGWVVLCLAVGVCEEIIYRGYCLSRLALAFGSATVAWLVQAALYGLLHFAFGPTWMAFTTGAGLFFGLVALWRRSLWPVVIVHVLVDILAAFHGQ